MAAQPSSNCRKRRGSSPQDDVPHSRKRLNSTNSLNQNASVSGDIAPLKEAGHSSRTSTTGAPERQGQSELCSSEEYCDMSFELELAMISEIQTLENSLTATPSAPADDDFHFGETDNDGCQSLSEQSIDTAAKHPPSSVIRTFDVESRFAEDYDPSLQFSSPHTDKSSLTCASVPSTETVDWKNIHRQASQSQHAVSVISYDEHHPDHRVPPSPRQWASFPQPAWTVAPANLRLFNPSRTCFRLSEIIDSKAVTVQRQPHAVYNVFARVLYSNRENFFRRQYFQLRDLLTESPPYLTGALLG
ncbi:hypothetical protein ED733_004731 [Metarhizium rileyi]|uniref:Uncharacterized protein n=1 Tax=Metarhizium rileyi (strain RCEF 4871) TaxID=1649241 RepID=A0A5C6G5E4_METRR|nr:hypothetical protein ED733_004731 [Metarhizium rileyi]